MSLFLSEVDGTNPTIIFPVVFQVPMEEVQNHEQENKHNMTQNRMQICPMRSLPFQYASLDKKESI